MCGEVYDLAPTLAVECLSEAQKGQIYQLREHVVNIQ